MYKLRHKLRSWCMKWEWKERNLRGTRRKRALSSLVAQWPRAEYQWFVHECCFAISAPQSIAFRWYIISGGLNAKQILYSGLLRHPFARSKCGVQTRKVCRTYGVFPLRTSHKTKQTLTKTSSSTFCSAIRATLPLAMSQL